MAFLPVLCNFSVVISDALKTIDKIKKWPLKMYQVDTIVYL